MLSGVNIFQDNATDTAGGGNAQALCNVVLRAEGDAATATIYDGTDASGRLLGVISAAAGVVAHLNPSCCPIAINSGSIHVVVTGTTPDYSVLWK